MTRFNNCNSYATATFNEELEKVVLNDSILLIEIPFSTKNIFIKYSPSI